MTFLDGLMTLGRDLYPETNLEKFLGREFDREFYVDLLFKIVLVW